MACDHDWVIDNVYTRLENGLALTNHSCRKCGFSLEVPDLEIMMETTSGFKKLNKILREYVAIKGGLW